MMNDVTTTPLTDESPMPLGKHKGTPMEDVPAEYLIWYKEEARRPNPQIIEYINDNWDALKKEVEKQ